VRQRDEAGGVDAGLVVVERCDVLGDGEVHRRGLGRLVVGACVEGGGQVEGPSHREAQAAPEGGVGGAHRVADGVQAGDDRLPLDDQAAEGVAQPGHREDVADRFEDLQPLREERHGPQYPGEDVRVPRCAEAVIGGRRADREQHRVVVGAPDPGGELVERRDGPGRPGAGRPVSARRR
jgi:hypothetical protein